MKRRALIRWVLVVALLPFAVQGVLVLAMQIWHLVRYQPGFFGEEYVQRYATPGAAAKVLEQALRTDDRALLAELEGLRWPRTLTSSPDIKLVMLWSHTGRYTTYLYFDSRTYERNLIPFEQERGRWVVAPQDLYYAFRSGGWRGYFLPVAIAWWLIGTAEIGLLWLCCSSVRFRSWASGR